MPPKSQPQGSQIDVTGASVGDVLQVLDMGGGVKKAGFAPGGGGGSSLEGVRDMLATTLVGEDGIEIEPDDAGDSIVVRYTGGGGAGGSYSMFIVDPHDPQFGAVGDGEVYDAMVLSQTTVAYDTVQIPNVVFDASYVGRKFWSTSRYLAPNGRTILSIAAGKLVLDIPLQNWEANGPCWIGTDDTVALNLALEYARDRGMEIGERQSGDAGTNTRFYQGGEVRLRSAVYLISNYDHLVRRGCLMMPRRAGLSGSGSGRQQTQLHVLPGSVGHIICNDRDAFSDFVHIGNMAIFGNGPSQTKATIDLTITGGQEAGTPITGLADAINLDTAGNGYDWVECFNHIHDLQIFQPGRDGIFLNGRGENIMQNVNITYAPRFGLWANSSDLSCVRVNVGGASKTGIRIENSVSSSFVGCKAYYCGGGANPVISKYGYVSGVFGIRYDYEGVMWADENLEGNAANFHLCVDNDFDGSALLNGCLSQESFGSAFVIESPNSVFIGCVAADPGRKPIGPQPASTNSNVGRPAAITGFHLKGGYCHNNLFVGCFARPEVAAYWADNWGWGNSFVRIEGVDGDGKGPQANKGDIWHVEPIVRNSDGTTLNFALNGGTAVAGPGASNTKNTKLRVNATAMT